jgi:hypothetical protein
MNNIDTIKHCKSCGFSGEGVYCSHCGRPFKTERITLLNILYDIFHLFTKFEMGFGYTLKQLIISPGHMQRTYIEGNRGKYQKSFSMFFICATFSAITRYWILDAFIDYYHINNPTDATEAAFFREYMVFLYIGLIPVYTLLVYLFFYKSAYNYAEMGVLLLYALSLFFLAGPFIFLLKFIWPYLDTAYIEFPVYSAYLIITMVNFFNRFRRWKVVLISLMIMLMAFLINQLMEGLVMRFM